jgi:hypothetical protein
MFGGLRRVWHKYPTPGLPNWTAANIDNVRDTFPPLTGYFSTPNVFSLSNGLDDIPTYIINGRNFDVGQVNAALRNNDITKIREIFNTAPLDLPQQINVLRGPRMPDPYVFNLKTRQVNINYARPELNTRSYAGVQSAMNSHPRLLQYLKGLGVATLVGVGVMLVLRGIDVISDILEAMSRTGGSYLFDTDTNNVLQGCILRFRSCGMDIQSIDQGLFCQGFDDPLITDIGDLTQMCVGYNYDVEQTVCRYSDPYADPESPQWLDISLLHPDQMIACVEPYTFGDLLEDLGLGSLLGPDSKMKNLSGKLSEGFKWILQIVIWVVIIIVVIVVIYMLIRFIPKKNKQQVS